MLKMSLGFFWFCFFFKYLMYNLHWLTPADGYAMLVAPGKMWPAWVPFWWHNTGILVLLSSAHLPVWLSRNPFGTPLFTLIGLSLTEQSYRTFAGTTHTFSTGEKKCHHENLKKKNISSATILSRCIFIALLVSWVCLEFLVLFCFVFFF